MKNRLLVILVTLCLAFSLVACSSGESGGQTAQTQEAAQEAPQTQEPSSAQSGELPPKSSEPENSPANDDVTADGPWRVYADFMAEGSSESGAFRSDEPASTVMTSQVSEDGTYFMTISADGPEGASLTSEAEAFSFVNSLVGNEYGSISKMCLVELTAGEYVIRAENVTRCMIRMELARPIGAPDGPFSADGLYTCTVDEAMSVTYTLTGEGSELRLYNGPAEDLSEAGFLFIFEGGSDSEQEIASYEPGAVVINYASFPGDEADGNSSLTGTVGADVAAVPAEPIEFDVDRTNTDENGAVLGTVTVPADGYYLFAADSYPKYEGAQMAFTTDLPVKTESDIVPDWTFSEKWSWYELRAAVELTAGDYTVAVGEAMYSAELIPAQMVDSLEGTLVKGGVYMCLLSEPMTMTFSVRDNDAGYLNFYGGNEGELLQNLSPEPDGGTITVNFPAGIAVVDASDYHILSSVTAAKP